MTSSSLSAAANVGATLPSGATMPLLGFGTWQLKGGEALQATEWALRAGYRLIDTATAYGNEGEVGAALDSAGGARDSLFVTTKLPPDRGEAALDTLRSSLEQLGVDAVDLWLIHWPAGERADVALWRSFGQARDQGLAIDIGVSNYSLEQLDELNDATGVLPAVNQIEWSPLLFDPAVLAGHRDRGVLLEGYSALRGGTLEHPDIGEIADRHGRTPAQVIVRWHLQHEIVVIPKSRERARIASNADIDGFELTGDEMAAIDGLGSSG